MPFKINIAEKSGKTYHLEFEGEDFNGKELKDKIEGKIIMPELEGYEFEIAGASDNAGFTSHESVTGIGLKKIILSYEKGMKKRPKREGKWKRTDVNPRGLRLRKTVRGKSISAAIAQINLKTLKEGAKKLSEIFPDQNQPKVAQKAEGEQAPTTSKTEAPKETPKVEAVPAA
ncbi:MAG: hypothetical protein KKB79_00710 [Nanoarchaeota archaeon]|nr:hypothetical protein [Nanoarchaeota archaeon]